MDVDWWEKPSVGRIDRMRKCEFNVCESDDSIKQEIKEEPAEPVQLIEFTETSPTLRVHNSIATDNRSGTNDQLNIGSDVDQLKEEIKCDVSENAQSIGSDGSNPGNKPLDNVSSTRHLCKRSTLILGNLKRHMRIHQTGNKPFESSVCTKTFTTKSNLGQHLRVYTEQLLFGCQKCGRRFTDGNEKQLHVDQCKRRRYECFLCSYKTFIKSHFKRHMCHKHTGDKRLQCLICDKKFVQKGELKQHLASHLK